MGLEEVVCDGMEIGFAVWLWNGDLVEYSARRIQVTDGAGLAQDIKTLAFLLESVEKGARIAGAGLEEWIDDTPFPLFTLLR